MNHLRQALHTAARYCAKEALNHFCEAELFADRAFNHAVNGKQLDRALAETRRHAHESLYRQWIYKARRVREMMK